MNVQIIARAKAFAHLWHNFNMFRGHEVWRAYRWFGFDTRRVFCSCGLEFTKKPPALAGITEPTVHEMLAHIREQRAMRKNWGARRGV